MTYLLRDIPDELWRKVKIQAAKNGESIRDAIQRLLKEYAKSK